MDMLLIAEYFEGKKLFQAKHPLDEGMAQFRIIECEPEFEAAIISAETSVTHDGLGKVVWQWPISFAKLLAILEQQG